MTSLTLKVNILTMEKSKRHYDLNRVKDQIRAGNVEIKKGALAGAKAMGFKNEAAMLDVVLALNGTDFDKSMTTHQDSKVWQDVYKPETDKGRVYVKITMLESVLIISFKKEEVQ